MKHYVILFFVIVALFDLFLVQTNYPFRHISKPLILITLIIYFVASMGKETSKHWLFCIALLFAFAGDVFLIGDGDTRFMLGLGSFLMMQLLYFVIFIRQKSIGVHKHFIKIMAILTLSVIFLYKLLPYTGGMKIPVIIYALSIAAMAHCWDFTMADIWLLVDRFRCELFYDL